MSGKRPLLGTRSGRTLIANAVLAETAIGLVCLWLCIGSHPSSYLPEARVKGFATSSFFVLWLAPGDREKTPRQLVLGLAGPPQIQA